MVLEQSASATAEPPRFRRACHEFERAALEQGESLLDGIRSALRLVLGAVHTICRVSAGCAGAVDLLPRPSRVQPAP